MELPPTQRRARRGFAIFYLLFAIPDEPRRVRLSATGGIFKKCSDGLLYVAHHRSA